MRPTSTPPAAPASADDLRQRVIDAARHDPRITGLLDYGSRSHQAERLSSVVHLLDLASPPVT